MFFAQRFDPKPGVSHEQMQDIHRRLATGWEREWPTNKLIGLFVRKWGMGTGNAAEFIRAGAAVVREGWGS